MGRVLRQNRAGIYHVVNRGVGLREVFLCTEDKLFFIQLLCAYASEYSYHLHSYTLINNGYNFIIETKKNNLSNIMKIINSRYTFHFNKKYGRRGYLWEGRFKSWHITNEGLLLNIIAYVEHLAVYTGTTKTKEGSYHSSYRQLIGLDKRLPCLKDSIVFQKFNHINKIKTFLNQPINIEYINHLHEKLKKQDLHSKTEVVKLPKLNTNDFLDLTKEERKDKIYALYLEGYTQKAIGIALGISQQAVHSIIKKITKI